MQARDWRTVAFFRFIIDWLACCYRRLTMRRHASAPANHWQLHDQLGGPDCALFHASAAGFTMSTQQFAVTLGSWGRQIAKLDPAAAIASVRYTLELPPPIIMLD
eukprot:COSAG05_NODE_49_length_24373_cov_16.162561_26_plen_105_part_00